MRAALLGACLLGACLLGAAGCVTQARYDQAATERDQLRDRVEDLSLRNRALRARLDRLDTDLRVTDRAAPVPDSSRPELEKARSTLAARLEPEAAVGLAAVRLGATGLDVELSEPLLFPSGSAELTDKGRALLARMAGDLRAIPFPIVVAGYTDDVPIAGDAVRTWPTNWDLAAARAARVVAVLESGGVPGGRLVAVSFGPNDPAAPNDSPEGRERNRRIELRIHPIGAAGEAVAAPP